jgi:hypothetical protein
MTFKLGFFKYRAWRSFLVLIVVLSVNSAEAQIKTEWLDTSNTPAQHELGHFFTNRKPILNEEGEVVSFKNRWIRQTKSLYFCRYDFDADSVIPKYLATKTCSKKTFPTEPVDNNFLYQVYQDLRIENGIRNFVFVIPGHAKTFEKQLHDWMFRLQHSYADSLRNTAFITFAWSSEPIGPLYYRGLRAADRSSNDFAIFQHMLESFVADSSFWERHPFDISIKLVSTSMGNELFRRYLIKREYQGIPLVQVYDRIILIGSDAPANSFDKGEAFSHLLEMTPSILVLVNRRDGPLTLSQVMNLEGRLGRVGPTNRTELPDNIVVRDVTNLIDWGDLTTLGHDYFLRNEVLKDYILHEELSSELPSGIEVKE